MSAARDTSSRTEGGSLHPAACSTHMTAVSKHRVAADPGPIGLQAGYMSLLACHASRSGYHGSGRPEAARQAAACSVSMASRRACAAASHPVKRKATGSGERSTASKASHAPGSPARPNRGSAQERHTACCLQPSGRSRRPEAGLDTAGKASQANQKSQARQTMARRQAGTRQPVAATVNSRAVPRSGASWWR